MSIAEYFSPDYAMARERFRSTAAGAAATTASYVLLVPNAWQGEVRQAADAALGSHAQKHGMAALRAAVSGGQYTRPGGLFYGGVHETWSARMLLQTLREVLPPHPAGHGGTDGVARRSLAAQSRRRRSGGGGADPTPDAGCLLHRHHGLAGGGLRAHRGSCFQSPARAGRVARS